MNAAMGWLLTTRAPIDSCQRRQVSHTETTPHQNEAKTATAIKEAKAHCTAAIREAEVTGVGHAYTHSNNSLGKVCKTWSVRP